MTSAQQGSNSHSGVRGVAETAIPPFASVLIESSQNGRGQARLPRGHSFGTALKFLQKNSQKEKLTFNYTSSSNPGRRQLVTVNFDAREPLVETASSRPRQLRVRGGTDREILTSLRALDGGRRNHSERKKTGNEFVRDSHRLDSAVDLIERLEEQGHTPSVSICPFQNVAPSNFGARPVSEERGLKDAVLAEAYSNGQMMGTSYRDNAILCHDLGDHTTHDPDTLPERFLEYIRPRVERATGPEERALLLAKKVMHIIWRRRGIAVGARPNADMTASKMDEIVTEGNAGEYRAFGATSRKEQRVMDMCVSHLNDFIVAGAALRATGQAPRRFQTFATLTSAFGKDESKAAKVGEVVEDGNRRTPSVLVKGEARERIAPVPRFIFSPSPTAYYVAAFLHHDISKELMKRDPTHGPGFGPGRGRAQKFIELVERAFGGANELVDSEMVMSDIAKWDASVREALLSIGYDTLEEFVDKSGLPELDRFARKAMSDCAKRTLLTKIVEHPSGYNVVLHGAMPSGSYYTSLLNTVCNDLLAIACVIRAMFREYGDNHEINLELVADAAEQWLLSYGDNQLFSTKLFSDCGVDYTKEDHADFLGRVGMRLKLDETEVTTRLSRVRFCSRALVRAANGELMVTRTHNAFYEKLSGRPTGNVLETKLYVRALMADYLGTDPVIFKSLSNIDETLVTDIGTYESIPARFKPMVDNTVAELFGDTSLASVRQFMGLLNQTHVSRSALLQLHLTAASADSKLGDHP